MGIARRTNCRGLILLGAVERRGAFVVGMREAIFKAVPVRREEVRGLVAAMVSCVGRIMAGRRRCGRSCVKVCSAVVLEIEENALVLQWYK